MQCIVAPGVRQARATSKLVAWGGCARDRRMRRATEVARRSNARTRAISSSLATSLTRTRRPQRPSEADGREPRRGLGHEYRPLAVEGAQSRANLDVVQARDRIQHDEVDGTAAELRDGVRSPQAAPRRRRATGAPPAEPPLARTIVDDQNRRDDPKSVLRVEANLNPRTRATRLDRRSGVGCDG
jgi:hypothetical protein